MVALPVNGGGGGCDANGMFAVDCVVFADVVVNAMCWRVYSTAAPVVVLPLLQCVIVYVELQHHLLLLVLSLSQIFGRVYSTTTAPASFCCWRRRCHYCDAWCG